MEGSIDTDLHPPCVCIQVTLKRGCQIIQVHVTITAHCISYVIIGILIPFLLNNNYVKTSYIAIHDTAMVFYFILLRLLPSVHRTPATCGPLLHSGWMEEL